MLGLATSNRSIIALIVLAAMSVSVPFLAQRLNAKAVRGGIRSDSAALRQDASAAEEDFFDFVETLPTHQELRESIDVLAMAGPHLLKTAARGDTEAISTAGEEYRQAMQRVRDSYKKLADRVGQDRAEMAFDELLTYLEADPYWAFTDLAAEMSLRD